MWLVGVSLALNVGDKQTISRPVADPVVVVLNQNLTDVAFSESSKKREQVR